MIPIGQLDGGHVLYALLLRRAHAVAAFLMFAAIVAVDACSMPCWERRIKMPTISALLLLVDSSARVPGRLEGRGAHFAGTPAAAIDTYIAHWLPVSTVDEQAD